MGHQPPSPMSEENMIEVLWTRFNAKLLIMVLGAFVVYIVCTLIGW